MALEPGTRFGVYAITDRIGAGGMGEVYRARAIVMELVAGEDLRERLGRGAMPIDEVLPVARQIVEAWLRAGTR